MAKFKHLRFLKDESGAVTVDWVVLAAMVVAMAVAVFTVVTQETHELGAERISQTMEDAASYVPAISRGEPPTPGG